MLIHLYNEPGFDMQRDMTQTKQVQKLAANEEGGLDAIFAAFVAQDIIRQGNDGAKALCLQMIGQL